MRKFWILGIFGTLCAVSARAADIYVAQTSTGGNTGANCANAQASSSLTATDWSAGNTIHLCGTFSGAAGSNIVTARGSGTSANPITLKFEAGAVLQAPYFSGSSGAINVSGRSYIIIDGGGPCGFTPASGDSSTTNCGVIQNTANGNILTYHQATKGIVISGSSNIEIKNLLIANQCSFPSLPGASQRHNELPCCRPQVQPIRRTPGAPRKSSIDCLARRFGWRLGPNRRTVAALDRRREYP